MTNHIDELKFEIEKFNLSNNSDLKFLRIIDDEVLFAELETSMSNELLFNFGVAFGKISIKKSIEND